jgi:uncharacterized protein YndB with AHSA1/START domain
VSESRLELIAPQDAPVIVFRRTFKAPASLVFEAWTEPRHLRHWRVPTFTYEPAPETEVLDEVTFAQNGSTTLVTGRSAFPTFQARELYAAAGAERGLAQCHERLDELLATLA